jgi:hypothetical protein
MKFTTKQDIEAPLAQVWAVLSDFEAWERAAMRRGVDVTRTDSLRNPGPGMGWKAAFRFRGRDRQLSVGLTRLEAPHHLEASMVSMALEGHLTVELIEMAARRTRMHVTSEFRPLSLGARLFLQSMRLARSRVERKYQARVAQFAAEIELRARQRRA